MYACVIAKLLIYVTMVALTGSIYMLPAQNARLLIWMSLILYTIVSWRQRDRHLKNRHLLLILPFILVSIIGGYGFSIGLYLLPLFLVSCVFVRNKRFQPNNSEYSLISISLIFVAAEIFIPEYIRIRFMEILSQNLYTLVTVFTKEVTPYGPSYNGLRVIACALPFFVWSIFTNGITWKKLVAAISLILFAMMQYFWNYQYLLILAICSVLVACEIESPKMFSRKSKKCLRGCTVTVAILLFVALVGNLRTTHDIEKRKQQVAFTGNVMGNWDLPNDGSYGSMAFSKGAQFGVFRKFFLHSYGWKEVSTERLFDESNGVLVIINPQELFNEKMKEKIWQFVAKGGGLLVLGDHTDIGGIQKPLNELLSPVSIKFNFDSAIPLDKGWNWYGCIKRLQHPALKRVCHEGDIQISVGASLNVGKDAQPLLIGTRAYSDIGRPWYGVSRLGNMQHDIGERFGDLILAAEASHGEGKVIVFGDTSSFQSLSMSQSYPLVSDILHYLITPSNHSFHHIWPVLGVLCYAIMLVQLMLFRQKLSILISSIAIVVYIACYLIFAGVRENDALLPMRNYVVIDVSHGTPFHLENSNPYGLEGLKTSILRRGYLPLVVERFTPELIKNAEYVVICGPSKLYDKSELECLEKYTIQGGNLILSVGETGRYNAKTLLNVFGVEVMPKMLGGVHINGSCSIVNNEEHKDQLHHTYVDGNSSCPSNNYNETSRSLVDRELHFCEAWALSDMEDKSRILCYGWEEYPIVLAKSFGDGKLCVIGDDAFFVNKNLEITSTKNPLIQRKNILFTKWLLCGMDNPNPEQSHVDKLMN